MITRAGAEASWLVSRRQIAEAVQAVNKRVRCAQLPSHVVQQLVENSLCGLEQCLLYSLQPPPTRMPTALTQTTSPFPAPYLAPRGTRLRSTDGQHYCVNRSSPYRHTDRPAAATLKQRILRGEYIVCATQIRMLRRKPHSRVHTPPL